MAVGRGTFQSRRSGATPSLTLPKSATLTTRTHSRGPTRTILVTGVGCSGHGHRTTRPKCSASVAAPARHRQGTHCHRIDLSEVAPGPANLNRRLRGCDVSLEPGSFLWTAAKDRV